MSALGAAGLAAAVFLPWYRVSAVAQASLGSSTQRSLTTISAHPVLADMKVLLLVLAGLALLDALLPLLRIGAPVPAGAGGSVALLGVVAAVCCCYRILDPPVLAGNVGGLSLLVGPWLALLAALVMVIGGTWPRHVSSAASPEIRVRGAWPGLPG